MSPTSPRSSLRKLAILTGSVTALGALEPAEAELIYVSGTPVAISSFGASGSSVSWDVDGADGDDFEMVNYSGKVNFGSFFLNGSGLVAPFAGTDNVQGLSKGFVVGPTLSKFAWGLGHYGSRFTLYPSGAIGYDWIHDIKAGPNYFGFRFETGVGALHYGWGTIVFDPPSGTAAIVEWAYETTAGASVVVGTTAVPEPATSALLLIGLGASGVRRWRSRRDGDAADVAGPAIEA